MNRTAKLDRIDIKILEVLQKNGRVSNVELANTVGLSASPCHRRLRAIEDSELIHSYVAILNRKAVGLELIAFVEVALDSRAQATISAFKTAIQERPEVMECHIITGDYDMLLRIASANIDSFREFIMNDLLAMPGVDRTRTNISLGEIKYTTALPLGLNSR